MSTAEAQQHQQQDSPRNTLVRRSSTLLKTHSTRFLRTLHRKPQSLFSTLRYRRRQDDLAFTVVNYDSIASFVCMSGPPAEIGVEEIEREEEVDKVYTERTFTVREVNDMFPKVVYATGDAVENGGGGGEDCERDMGDLPLAADLAKYKDCAVCLDVFQKQDQVRVLPCGHVYHDACVKVWLVACHAHCPTCRLDFGEHVPIRW